MFFLDFGTVPNFTYKTDFADREAAAVWNLNKIQIVLHLQKCHQSERDEHGTPGLGLHTLDRNPFF